MQFVGEPRVAQRVRDLRLPDDVGELLRAQQRHRADRDRARFHHGEPARGHPRRIRSAQQNAVARDDMQVVDEDVRDAIGVREQVRVRPFDASRRDDRAAVPPSALDRAVEELRRAVHPRRMAQFGQVEQELRPLLARRQVVARERIDVCGVRHRGPPLVDSIA
jgi:hypothetical protein